MKSKKKSSPLVNRPSAPLVDAIQRQADRRGHGKQTRGAGIGGLIGGMLGSFAGPAGAALGGALGALLGTALSGEG